MRILPYNMSSKSAKVLAQTLGTQCVRPDGNFRNNHNHTIVNWGWGGTIGFPHNPILNNTRAVDNAANKLTAFRCFERHGVPTPEWTTDRDRAVQWDTIVSRTVLRGHSGAGIYIAGQGELPVEAPLYVQYIKKQDEYRYHVFNGDIIDVQQKRKRRSTENDEVNYQVRSHSTGWVYCRDGITTRSGLDGMAIAAVEALGLDFGGVDIIWNSQAERGYVLEVNTAVGLSGSTVGIYANAILRAL